MPLYSADIFGIIKNEYALYRENQDKQFISNLQLYLNITGNAYSALVFSDLKNDYVKKCIESGEKSATKQLFSAIHKAMSSSRKNQKNSEVFNNISMG